MKAVVALVYSMLLSSSALAERTVFLNGAGSVQLPPGYIHDPNPGIQRPEDAKHVRFTRGDKVEENFGFLTDERGELAGHAAKPSPDSKTILSKWTSEVNGHKVSVIVYENKNAHGPVRGGAIVSYPDLKVDFACDYTNEGHLADFMFVALSYKPAEQAAPTNEKKLK